MNKEVKGRSNFCSMGNLSYSCGVVTDEEVGNYMMWVLHFCQTNTSHV